MKRLFITTLLIGSIIGLVFFAVTEVFLQKVIPVEAYMGATLEKQELIRTIPSPRIIITGGSNAAFGIDSKTIQDSTGYNVVNMALHAGLGLHYILYETLDGVKEGDIVILIPEYFLSEGELRLAAYATAINRNAVAYTNQTPFNWCRMKLYQFQIFFRLSFFEILNITERDPIYRRSGFNEYGDLVSHLDGKTNKQKQIKKKYSEYDYTDELKLINDFIDSVHSKNATVYYCFPNNLKSVYNSNKKVLDDYFNLVEREVKCPIIGTPQLFHYNDDDVFDTPYHLKQQARIDRTGKLIQLLKVVINKKAPGEEGPELTN